MTKARTAAGPAETIPIDEYREAAKYLRENAARLEGEAENYVAEVGEELRTEARFLLRRAAELELYALNAELESVERRPVEKPGPPTRPHNRRPMK